mgnify:FL=1
MKKILLDKSGIDKLLLRMSHEIVEWLGSSDTIAIIGIRTRGDIIAKRIANNIISHYNIKVQYGILDVTFHRDDFSSNLGSPKVGPSEISFNVNEQKIVLIDDDLYTGRTIRAAIDEIFSFGRPSVIKLGVLVDRGHRELPIKADFIGKNYPTSKDEHVHVLVNEIDDVDKVELVKY